MTRDQLPSNKTYTIVPQWLSASVVMAMATALFGGVWYAATMEARVAYLERRDTLQADTPARLIRLEEQVVVLRKQSDTLQVQNSEIIRLLRSTRESE